MKTINQYKKAHKDMINWLINHVDYSFKPQDYLDHLLIQESKGEQVFYPGDYLYYCCAYADMVRQEQQDIKENQCKYCPFQLDFTYKAWHERSCDYWFDLPNSVQYMDTLQEIKEWKRRMRQFRDFKWKEWEK